MTPPGIRPVRRGWEAIWPPASRLGKVGTEFRRSFRRSLLVERPCARSGTPNAGQAHVDASGQFGFRRSSPVSRESLHPVVMVSPDSLWGVCDLLVTLGMLFETEEFLSSIDDRQRQRDEYLIALYELSEGGQLLKWATHAQIAERSNIPDSDVMSVGQFLVGEKFVEFKTMAGMAGSVAITTRGVGEPRNLFVSGKIYGGSQMSSSSECSSHYSLRSRTPSGGSRTRKPGRRHKLTSIPSSDKRRSNTRTVE